MAVSAMHIAPSLGLAPFKAFQTASQTPLRSQPLGCECQQKAQKVGGTNFTNASKKRKRWVAPISAPCWSQCQKEKKRKMGGTNFDS
jgi:hypothetical protein